MTVAFFLYFAESHDSGNFYFCFRWILIHFKREFHFQEIHRLWEVRNAFICPMSMFILFGEIIYRISVLQINAVSLFKILLGETQILQDRNNINIFYKC